MQLGLADIRGKDSAHSRRLHRQQRRRRRAAERIVVCGAVLLASALAPATAAADPALEQRLAIVDAEIAKNPNDARLYLQRGEIHRGARNWTAAAEDYDRARTLDPKLDEVWLAQGELMLAAEAPQKAIEHLSRYIEAHPDHARARLARARAYARTGAVEDAAADYDRALALMPAPQPDHVLERARLLAKNGKADLAMRGLDEMMRKLGEVPVLQLEAVQLDTERKRYDEAVRRLDSLLRRTPRQPAWMARRAEILALAGRKEDARRAYDAALEVIHSQPPSRQALPAIRELEERIKQGREKLK